MPDQALPALPSAPIADIAELGNRMQQIAKQANLVSPFVHLDYIPEMHRVSFRSVRIDTELREVKRGDYVNQVGTDTYIDKKFCQLNERALTKTGVLKIFRAAGVSVIRSARIDDRRDALYAEWRVSISVPELDGGKTTMEATKTIDLRPGSPQRERMTDRQAQQAMTVLLENAETKALLRAARAALQIRQVYTVDELAKPFVIPVLVPSLDTSDPEIKRMVAAQALGLSDQVYGPQAIKASPAETVPDDIDPDTGEVIDAEDFGDIPDVEPEAAHACACPCGHAVALSPEVARMTAERVGSPRCSACYPAKSFDYEAHQALGDLDITDSKGNPITPAMAHEIAERARGAKR